jgi:hypothetical protein
MVCGKKEKGKIDYEDRAAERRQADEAAKGKWACGKEVK